MISSLNVFDNFEYVLSKCQPMVILINLLLLDFLLTSSYNRAYGTLVRVQQLTEIEEILQHKKRVRKHGNAHHPVVREQRKRMHQLWRDRLTVCHQKVRFISLYSQ